MKINLIHLSSRASSIASLIISGGLSLLNSAKAQTNFSGPSNQLPPVTKLEFNTVTGILCTLLTWLFTLLIVVTVIYVIYAAFLYLTAGGEEEKVKKANHQLVYAAVALAVAILSRGIPFLIGNLVGSQSFNGC